MRRIAVAVLLIFSCAVKTSALNALVSHTVFYTYADSAYSPFVEVVWEFDPVSLTFIDQEGAWQARVRVDILFSNETGMLKEDHFIFQTLPQPDKSRAATQKTLDLHRYLIPPGRCRMQITFTDLQQENNNYVFTDSIIILQPRTPWLSNLQLIDTAFESKLQSPFLRNGMQHIPLRAAFLDEYRKELRFYFEMYGLDSLVGKGPFIQSSYISKKENDPPYEGMQQTDTLQSLSVVPYYGKFSTRSLHSGNYYLHSGVYDNAGRQLGRSSIFFQVLNKHPVQDSLELAPNEFDTSSTRDIRTINIAKTFVGKYDHQQLRAILKMLLPISEGMEKQNIYGFLSKPSETYTRYFIYNFWLNRNSAKPEKAWEEYADRVREVNRLFGTGSKPGYETDQGIIYLKYGKPNERIIVSAESEAHPYEVWQYFTIKGQGKDGVFLFYKPPQFANDYLLLHSTVTGEARDMNWRNTLYPNGRDVNRDSQAEQYLRNR